MSGTEPTAADTLRRQLAVLEGARRMAADYGLTHPDADEQIAALKVEVAFAEIVDQLT